MGSNVSTAGTTVISSGIFTNFLLRSDRGPSYGNHCWVGKKIGRDRESEGFLIREHCSFKETKVGDKWQDNNEYKQDKEQRRQETQLKKTKNKNNKTKQNKTKQNKTEQNKTKQNEPR